MPTHPKHKLSTGGVGKGGPLKRTGPKSAEWDDVIGPSLESIPATQLPTVKTVLQRYRGYRIANPLESKAVISKHIAKEVKFSCVQI